MGDVDTFDVVVVGAGPSGAVCAHDLARGGARVALIEREALPRYKPCGGGITGKTVRWLPFSIEPVVEREVRGLTVSYRMGGMRTFYADRPLGCTVMRDRFDHYLVQQAQSAGATFFEGEPVTAVELPAAEGAGKADGSDAGVRLVTPQRTLGARVLVGADGAKGIVARSLGLQPVTQRWVAMECEVRLRTAQGIPLDTLVLDFHSSAAADLAYAWVFPKADLLSLGAAGGTKAGGGIKAYCDEYFQRMGLQRQEVVRRVGHTLPCRLTATPLVRGPALLIGDAAGMVEPFTGEGIAYAVRSGRLAAQHTLDYVAGRTPSLAGYQRAVDDAILPDLRRAYALEQVSRTLPWLTYLAFVGLPRFREIVFGLMRGDRRFRQATAKLRPFEPLLRRLEPPLAAA